ncbi:hypothetical protein FSP39_007488 [Pinctada imbricata]|uniref:B box-type domain-containing protein n=1 Tax=Pinctada imbricata TaxID=66713 RepID=A0AA88XCM7_PINIB|nr:hypothetical protein FSP39_007488 [Pinctada imbricata]
MSAEENFAYVQRPIPCDTCENEAPGTYYCTDCRKTICEECEKFHKKLTINHNVILRTQLADTDVNPISCAEHDKQASFHCEGCDTPVCGTCITGKHQGHKMVDLHEVIEEKRKVILSKMNSIQENSLPNHFRQREEMRIEKEEREKDIKMLAGKMEAENKYLHEILDRIHHERMKKLDNYKESCSIIFDSHEDEIEKGISFCGRRVSEYEDALRKNSFAEVKKLAERNEPLPQVRDKPNLPRSPSFIPADVTEIVGDFVKLQAFPPSVVVKHFESITPTIISKFKSPLQGYPRISITKKGNAWLAGHNERKLAMVDMKGRVLDRRIIENRPFALAVMENGDVVINPRSGDSSSVTRLLLDGTEIPIFDSASSGCYGISVTADQKILISTCDGRVLRIDGVGANVKQIYKGSTQTSSIHAVEGADGNIFISDWAIPAVVIVNNDGKVLSTITQSEEGETVQEPSCLVLDNMGNICCSDRAKDCIYIIDKSRKMRKLVGKSLGIKRPRFLAVDCKNYLWVTQRDGSIFVLRYL